MNPGKRDKRIVIEHKTERKDEEGNALRQDGKFF